MRKHLLAGVALASLWSGQARAVDVVTDPGLLAAMAQKIGLDAGSWATQAADMTAQITKTTATLQQISMLYSMMNNPVALVGAASSLLSGGAQSPLGDALSSSAKLASGVGRLANTASSLAGQVQDTNTFYLPPLNGSFLNSVMTMRSNQTSAVQGQLTVLMNGMPDRLFGLQQLQSEINMGGDVNRMASLNARMQSEVAMANEQARQAQILIGLAQIQDQVERQQLQQKARLDSDQWAASRAAASNGLIGANGAQSSAVVATSYEVPSFPVSP
ncbi:MAG: hypothetical protein JWP29_1968 [Rhodoferax sp.]|nr:hypothetical protein [Rhodoferax sp.]